MESGFFWQKNLSFPNTKLGLTSQEQRVFAYIRINYNCKNKFHSKVFFFQKNVYFK